MPEGNPTTPPPESHANADPPSPLRCPECGETPSSRHLRPKTLRTDPRRWMPWLTVAALVLFQLLSHPLSKPWTSSGEFGWTAEVPHRLIGEAMTAADCAAAANGDAERLEAIRQLVDSFADAPDADPSARLTIQSAFSATKWEPSHSPEWASYGWPIRWLDLSPALNSAEFDEYARYDLGVNWFRINFESPFGSAPSNHRLIFIRWPRLLNILAVGVFAALLLRRLLLFPPRLRSRVPRSSRCIMLAVAIAAVLAFVLRPTAPSPAYRHLWEFGFSWTGTPLAFTFAQARAVGQTTTELQNFARLIADTNTPGPLVVTFQPTISGVLDRVQLGYPYPFFEAVAWEKGAPKGTAPVPGAWAATASTERIDLAYNKGAWPGTSIGIGIWPQALLSTATLITLAALAARAAGSRILHTRAKRRSAAQQCTHCGYDLKGLRAITPST